MYSIPVTYPGVTQDLFKNTIILFVTDSLQCLPDPFQQNSTLLYFIFLLDLQLICSLIWISFASSLPLSNFFNILSFLLQLACVHQWIEDGTNLTHLLHKHFSLLTFAWLSSIFFQCAMWNSIPGMEYKDLSTP